MTRTGKMAAVLALAVVLSPAAVAGPEDTAEDQIRQLRTDLLLLKAQVQRLEKDGQAERQKIADQLDRIEKSLEKLQTRASDRRSLSIDPNPQTGTIRLRNDMAVLATVTINGEFHVLRPFGTKTLRNQPTGAISYYISAEGLRNSPLVRSRVNANETLTIRVYDPRDEQ